MRRAAIALVTLLGAFAACGEDSQRGGPVSQAGESAQAGASDAGAPGSAGDGAGGAVPVVAGEAGRGGGDAGEASGGAAGAVGDPYGDLRHPPYPPSPYPPENPDSDAKALLGKILFWDEQLGGDGTVACGTCHRPNAGGSDPRSTTPAAASAGPDNVVGTLDDVHGSLGVLRCNAQGEPIGSAVQVTARKAPTYLDAMFAPRLFWDGRAECAKEACPSLDAFEDPDAPGTFPIAAGGALENQAVGPPLSAVEMACEGASWASIHERLKLAEPLALAHDIPDALASFIDQYDGQYPKLFQAAFGNEQTSGPSDEINTRRIAFAIATHERRLRSDQTPWDRFNAGEVDALSAGQIRGLQVFLGAGKCEGCHRMPTFSDGDFHFIGFHRPSWDQGRKAVVPYGVPGALRTPTLRNVGLRAATGLLHNGAGTGASLAAIIDLYDAGGLIDDAEVTSVPIDAAIVPLGLSPGQKLDLLDFLQHALEDPRVLAQLPPFDRPLLATE
jgi:cytochrome c peroxidase